MPMKTKRRSRWLWLLLIPALAIAAFFAWQGILLLQIPKLTAADMPFLAAPQAGVLPETEAGQALLAALEESWQAGTVGDAAYSGGPSTRKARQELGIHTLDLEKLSQGMAEELQEILTAEALGAARSDQVYGEDGNYLPAVSGRAFVEVLNRRLAQKETYGREENLSVTLGYDRDRGWHVQEDGDYARLSQLRGAIAGDPDQAAAKLYADAMARQEIVHRTYAPLAEDRHSGPVPNESFFGATTDKAEVAALLRSDPARRLIGEEKLVWNEEIQLYPDSVIHYYLDDTILALTWQEVEANCQGTFSEVFIADGSQLRRKISGDELFSLDFRKTTEFSQMANAVVGFGGDFYYHARECGVVVYEREMARFEPNSCDDCYITSDGDMLFTYRGEFLDQFAARRFIKDNDVVFSLCFGPVLIDNGQDVTPEEYYPWGEIFDTYARSALGMLGRHHYLVMNLNAGSVNSGYYNLATLRQAADAMIERGCIKAYTLDGGQTATTAFHGELINAVQFGAEKSISDIIYFATAVPG